MRGYGTVDSAPEHTQSHKKTTWKHKHPPEDFGEPRSKLPQPSRDEHAGRPVALRVRDESPPQFSPHLQPAQLHPGARTANRSNTRHDTYSTQLTVSLKFMLCQALHPRHAHDPHYATPPLIIHSHMTGERGKQLYNGCSRGARSVVPCVRGL